MTLAQAFVLQLLTKGVTFLLCFRTVQISLNRMCTTGLIFICRKWDAHWLHGVELLHTSVKTSAILSLGNEVELFKILFQQVSISFIGFYRVLFLE